MNRELRGGFLEEMVIIYNFTSYFQNPDCEMHTPYFFESQKLSSKESPVHNILQMMGTQYKKDC